MGQEDLKGQAASALGEKEEGVGVWSKVGDRPAQALAVGCKAGWKTRGGLTGGTGQLDQLWGFGTKHGMLSQGAGTFLLGVVEKY